MTTSQHTFDRSLQHYQEGMLDSDAWFRIVERDYIHLVQTFHWARLFAMFPSPLRLLDIGCGTGKFPYILRPHLPSSLDIQYDALDPSAYCLTTLKASLLPPYTSGRQFQTSLEDFKPASTSHPYHIIWAIQSLYCLSRQALPRALKTIHQLLHPTMGLSIILLAKHDSFFHHLYHLYNAVMHQGKPEDFLTAESITQCLTELGLPYRVREFDCLHTIPQQDTPLLTNYLQQCVMEKRLLQEWEHSPALRAFLDSFLQDQTYQFPNPVQLILSTPSTNDPSAMKTLEKMNC